MRIPIYLSALIPLAALAASGAFADTPSPDRGKLLGIQCTACHRLQADDTAIIGPHLGDLLGREVGGVTGYTYSEALAAAEFQWTEETLDAWLADPAEYLPGNKMAMAGIPSARDRADIIAWLREATAGGDP